MSDRDRQDVVAALRREAAAGRLDVDEVEARVAQASVATRRQDLTAALGGVEPVERISSSSFSRDGWARLRSPIGVAGVLLAAVALVAVVAAVTPLAFGFHPAFFWIVPLVGFKVAKFHGRRGWGSPRLASEDTVSV